VIGLSRHKICHDKTTRTAYSKLSREQIIPHDVPLWPAALDGRESSLACNEGFCAGLVFKFGATWELPTMDAVLLKVLSPFVSIFKGHGLT